MDKPSENSGFLGDKFSGQEVNPSAEVWDGIAAGIGNGPLASAFSAYEENPSSAVWSGIEAAIHPQRRRAIVWWWSSAASFLLLLGLASYLLMVEGVSHSGFVLNQPDIGPLKSELILAENADDSPLVEDSQNADNQLLTNEADNSGVGTSDNLADDSSPTPGSSQTDGIDAPNQPPADRSAVAQNDPEPGSFELEDHLDSGPAPMEGIAVLSGIVDHSIPERNLIHFPFIPPPPGHEPLAESGDHYALAGSFSPFFNATSGGTARSNSPLSVQEADQITNDGAGGESPVTTFVDELNSANTETQYAPPLTFGVQFIALNHKRISLGTGIDVTTLRGNSTTSFGSLTNEQRFNQQYLGVPVFAQIHIVRKEKFGLYARTGGVLDIGWRSKTDIEDYDAGELINAYSYRFRPGNQVRMINALGVRSQLTESFGVFVEGNGSLLLYQSNSNLWSGRRFWPSLGVGVSVGF